MVNHAVPHTDTSQQRVRTCALHDPPFVLELERLATAIAARNTGPQATLRFLKGLHRSEWWNDFGKA